MNKIIENFKVVVFQNYANFNGRAKRSEYWYFFLANFIISFVLGLIEGVGGTLYEIEVITSSDESIFSNIYSLLVLIPSIAVGIRRMHDSDKSGWWIVVPFYNLYLLIRKGTEGPNRFGENPLPAVVPSVSSVPTQQ